MEAGLLTGRRRPLAPAAALAVAALLQALAGCGPGGRLARCGASADCGGGLVCERPVASEEGVCIAPFRVALEAPAGGSWVGLAGAVVRASLSVQASGRTEPPAIDLVDASSGASLTALARVGPGLYQATFAPAPGSAGTLSLAAVVARATTDETQSATVPVQVDAVAPTLALTASCAATCLRDGLLAIRATPADDHLAGATASLDLDPARSIDLIQPGGGAPWQADVDLGSWPFAALARDATVTVRARDLAGNETVRAVTLPVTRLRWAYDAGAPVTSPALLADGTLVAGVSTTTSQLLALHPDGTRAWAATVGTGFLTAPPSVGAGAIWVGSQDGRVYAVAQDGSAVLNGAGCNTGGTIQGAPAVAAGATDLAFATSAVGRIFAIAPPSLCAAGPLTDTFTAAAAIDGAGKVLAATATATATLKKYSFDGAAFVPAWSASVGVNVSAPLALDTADVAYTGSQDARLDATTAQGTNRTVKTLSGSIVDSPIVLAGGDLVVGDQARVLHRFHPDGSSAWAVEPALDGAVLAPIALSGGPAALLVPTAAGSLYAVADDGTVLWSGSLAPGQALRAGNVRTAPAAAFGTAYFGSADGHVYAVVIEGGLDTAAPWPKVHRDSRNGSDARGTLP